jgi:pimeloyl-ACP methyl ester carboxylesterase
MKQTLFLIGLVLSSALCAYGQSNRINYMIAIAKFQDCYNKQQGDSLYATFAAPMRAALSKEKTQDLLKNLNLQFGKLLSTSVVKETAENSVYKGVFEKGNYYIVFPLNDKNQLNGLFFQPIPEEKNIVETKNASNCNALTQLGDTLFGTLENAIQAQPNTPIVLIIAGSGPTDRDGNNLLGVSANSYKMLADSLAQAGIASVRYDKRGVGASAAALKDQSKLRFEDMVADAVAFIQKIKSLNQYKEIYIIGHSEGSLIGMLAAAQVNNIAGFISIAGAGESADLIIKRQIKEQQPDLYPETERILEQLKQGKSVQVSNDTLASLFNPSIQGYMRSWIKYNPQTIINTLSIPILIIQGTNDLQVVMADATNLKKAAPKAQLAVIEGMNHVLKITSKDLEQNRASYTDPKLALPSTLIHAIAQFAQAK